MSYSLTFDTLVKKDLSVRMHVCPVRNLKIDRDVDAARNILARAPSAIPMGSTGDPGSGYIRAERPVA